MTLNFDLDPTLVKHALTTRIRSDRKHGLDQSFFRISYGETTKSLSYVQNNENTQKKVRLFFYKQVLLQKRGKYSQLHNCTKYQTGTLYSKCYQQIETFKH